MKTYPMEHLVSTNIDLLSFLSIKIYVTAHIIITVKCQV